MCATLRTLPVWPEADGGGRVGVQLHRPLGSQQGMLSADAPGQSIDWVVEHQHEGVALRGHFVAEEPAGRHPCDHSTAKYSSS